MALSFRHPTSGEAVKAVGSYTWLWAFLGRPFYFAYKGLWGRAVMYVFAALGTLGVSWFIYPFFAKRLVVNRYVEAGWMPDRTIRSAG